MLRLHVAVLLSLFSLPTLASETTTSIASRRTDKADAVIVHFGDSTCITSYLPAEQRVEAVLNERLSAFYENESIVSHNVAAGGDYIRQFLDSGRYKKAVKDRIPHIDIALIRYATRDNAGIGGLLLFLGLLLQGIRVELPCPESVQGS